MAEQFFLVGFFAALFVRVGVLMLVDVFNFKGIEGIVFGGSIVGYLFFYIGFWLWLKKKSSCKIFKANLSCKVEYMQ